MLGKDQKPTFFGGSFTFIHIAVMALSMLVTVTAWQFSKYQIETRIRTRFEASRDIALGLITERMKKYEDALWAGVAAVRSHDADISYQDWHTFARTLRIEEKYPGINGVGVIHFLNDATLAPYLARQRHERPGFRVHPAHDHPQKMPISYIEPEAANAAAVGLDVAHEINRRTAALASRDSGTAQITGPIVLVQDAGHTPGFLFYAPFYAGAQSGDGAEGRGRPAGAVYAPFVVRKLMEGLLAKDLREIRFSITDGHEMIYDEHEAEDPFFDPDPIFKEEVSLDLHGRTWTLDVRSDLAFRTANTYAQPTLILLAGLLIEGLIVALLFIMSRANYRAVAYAQKVTGELQCEKSKLAETNEILANKNAELEKFAYVASHDLKTPVRGIGGLTEMIEEDLEPYFAMPDANPDVRSNLKRIHDRVARMIDLTRGVMAFARVDMPQEDSGALLLEEVMETLRIDLDLAPGQLCLSGDVTAIDVDAFNFRRVVENLVVNAVKHHDNPAHLRIDVTARAEGAWCRVTIGDNGPGIDAKYHQKIFDVFQTLRTGDMPESTGIGLSIVKKAVVRHRGTINVVSSAGQGAAFHFDWPRNAGGNDSAASEAA